VKEEMQKILLDSLMESVELENLGIGGGIMLKWILEK
jgi:hypothetical protein